MLNVGHIMTTWFDIEPLIDQIESLDKETLEAFSRVTPPPSQNPAFHHKFDHTKERILRQLNQIEKQETLSNVRSPISEPSRTPTNDPSNWHEKPLGKLFYQVIGGLILACVIYLIYQNFGIHL